MVDLHTGLVTTVARLPANAVGVGWMSVADPWLVWVEQDSESDFGVWKLFAWSRETRTTIQVASSQLPDGTYLSGEVIYPVVGRGYVAWVEPVSQSAVELRAYRFDTKSTVVIDKGRLSSPLFVGTYLAWATLPPSGSDATFTVVDAATLARLPTPPELRTPRAITWAAGSSDYLVWAPDGRTWMAQSVKDRRISTFLTPQDGSHNAQFPMVTGNFLIWWSGLLYTVIDLRNGRGFDYDSGSAAGAGDLLVTTGLRGHNETISSVRPSTLDLNSVAC
jgi:hypothetical protein